MKSVIIIVIAFILLIPTSAFSQSSDPLQPPGFGPPIFLEEKKIPDWVRNIFLWYGQEQISETELLGAIKYLIDSKILIVQSTGQEKFSDDGDFKLVFGKSDNPTFQVIEKMFNHQYGFIPFVGAVNLQYSLPYDVGIKFKECGVENAYYSSINRELVMCYELIEYLNNFYIPISYSQEEHTKHLLNTILFIFFHEIGHVLIDVYDLPITGQAEDAVDQFSALTFIEFGEQGRDIVRSAALFFLVQGLEKTKMEDLKFWDEHSLDLQRFYNLTCLIYGSDPEGTSGLVSSGSLPLERAVRCPSEYAQADKSWQVLLEPFRK